MMRTKIFLTSIASFIAILTLAAQRTTFRDKQNNMSIISSSWKTTFIDQNTIGFKALGNPLVASWKEQGLTLQAKEIDGIAKQEEKGCYQLQSAKASGSVNTNIQSTSTKGEKRLTRMKCDSLEIKGETSQAILTGQVNVETTQPEEKKTWTLSGHRTVVQLTPLGKKADWHLKQVNMAGPVHMRYVGRVKGADPASNRQAIIVGRANSLTYNDDARTITLTGNVRMEGEDSLVAGEVEAEKAVIRLNQAREIQEIEFFGDPGRTVYKGTKNLNLQPAFSSLLKILTLQCSSTWQMLNKSGSRGGSH